MGIGGKGRGRECVLRAGVSMGGSGSVNDWEGVRDVRVWSGWGANMGRSGNMVTYGGTAEEGACVPESGTRRRAAHCR